MRSFWTKPMKQMLVECWINGDSTLTIAAILNRQFPEHGRKVTVGSIASQVSQLRRKGSYLPVRPKEFQQERRAQFAKLKSENAQKKEQPAKKEQPVKTEQPIATMSLCSLLELGYGMCRWPVDVNGGTMYCGGATGGKTYCEKHATLSQRVQHEQQRRSHA